MAAFCAVCGAPRRDDAMICVKCGADLRVHDASLAASVRPVGAAASPSLSEPVAAAALIPVALRRRSSRQPLALGVVALGGVVILGALAFLVVLGPVGNEPTASTATGDEALAAPPSLDPAFPAFPLASGTTLVKATQRS